MDWRENFNDRFGDTFRLCCDDKTLQGAVESFIENLLEEERQRMSEYVEKLKRTKKRLLGVDGVTDETHDAGINHAVEKVLSIINSK